MGKKGKDKASNRDFNLVKYFNEQRGVCYICREDMTLELGKPNTATIEHLQPRSKGGAVKQFNELAACSECNNLKSNRLPAEFLRAHVGYLAKLKEEAAEDDLHDNIIPFPQRPDEPRAA